MITITLKGMDIYLAIAQNKKFHNKIAEIYDVNPEEIEFFATEGFVIHNGIEQTSFRLNIEVEAPEEFEDEDLEIKVKDALIEGLKDVAIHFHIVFRYFNPSHEYMSIDEDYPLYMTDSNTVKAIDPEAEHDHEHEEEIEDGEEPYMDDIIAEFDEYVKEHPNATNKEVYEALAGIREKVAEDHADDEAYDLDEEDEDADKPSEDQED